MMEMSKREEDEENAHLSTLIESDDGDGEREVWSKKIEGMLAFVGLCVGLGNLWRFPYLCMRNGGGAFLIPFLLCLLLCGFPLFFLELSLGQFTGKDALHTWEVCPIFRGVGYGMVITTVVVCFYYIMTIAWIMFYIANSFISPLPWRSCDNDWNTAYCISTRSSDVSVHSHDVSDGNRSFTISNLITEMTENSTSLQPPSQASPELHIKHRYVTAEEEFLQYIGDVLSLHNKNLVTTSIPYTPSPMNLTSRTLHTLLHQPLTSISTYNMTNRVTLPLSYMTSATISIFLIVNFPFLDSNIPASPTYDIVTCSNYPDFPDRSQLLTNKLTNQGFESCRYRTLDISSGIDVLGGMPWHLAVCLLAAWTLVTLCLLKGIISMGKVVYVTATLPYILLTIILIRALFLPGATDGILFFITPDFSKLAEAQVWVEAALQVFYSLCPAWGELLTMASFNKFHNNCYSDSIVLTIISEGTSIYGGFVVFAVIGYMAHDANLPISTVVKSGPGLGFVVYPEALAKLPLPNLWSVLFFLMLLSVALDSVFASMELVIAAITNHFRVLRKRHVLVTLCVTIIFFLLGLVFCTQAGIYVYQLLDWYVAVSLPVFGFIECLIVGWIYGAERFSRDVEMMLGRGIPVFVRICWCFINPVVLAILFASTFISYKPPTYGDYVYPSYVNLLGWCIGILPLVPVILVGVATVLKTPGETIFEKFKASFKPSPYWKPISTKYASGYNVDNSMSSLGFWEQMKVNVLGNQ